MRSTRESITLPLMRRRAEAEVLGWMLFPLGLAVLVLMWVDLPPEWNVGLIVSTLFVAFWGMSFLGAGLYFLLLNRMRLHLVPEGAAVTLFGRTIARYPASELTAFCWTASRTNTPREKHLCLSLLSMEELAARQEQKLRASWYYRSGVDRRKTRGRWVKEFAYELLEAKSWQGYFRPLRQYGLCLEDTPEIRAFLNLMFPQLSWNQKPWEPPLRYSAVKKQKPTKDRREEFLRCHEGIMEAAGNMLMLVPCLPAPVILVITVILFGENETALLVSCCAVLIWMFGSMFLLGRVDRLCVEEQGFRIRVKGKKDRVISVDSVKSVWCFSMCTQSGVADYLMFCPYTQQELVEMEQKRMEKTRRGREELSALQLLDSWPRLVVRRYVMRRAVYWGYWDRVFLLVGLTPDRERWILEQHPHLQALHLEENPDAAD